MFNPLNEKIFMITTIEITGTTGSRLSNVQRIELEKIFGIVFGGCDGIKVVHRLDARDFGDDFVEDLAREQVVVDAKDKQMLLGGEFSGWGDL